MLAGCRPALTVIGALCKLLFSCPGIKLIALVSRLPLSIMRDCLLERMLPLYRVSRSPTHRFSAHDRHRNDSPGRNQRSRDYPRREDRDRCLLTSYCSSWLRLHFLRSSVGCAACVITCHVRDLPAHQSFSVRALVLASRQLISIAGQVACLESSLHNLALRKDLQASGPITIARRCLLLQGQAA